MAAWTLLVVIVISSVSLWTPWLRVCAGTAACRPLQLSDPPIVLTGLLVVIMVFPSLKRLKFGGFEMEQLEQRPEGLMPGQAVEELMGTRAKNEEYVRTIEGEESQGGSTERAASGK
jgi:hypothetical protein